MSPQPSSAHPSGLAVAVLASLLALVIAGCPPDLQPARPDGGRACTRNEDCNPALVTCGELYLCVDELCEDRPSQIIPCR